MSSNSIQILKVGDFAKVKGGKRMPAGTALTPHKSKHPYLRIVDFKDGGIDKSNLLYVPDEVFPQIARYVISDRDLYISIVGTIGLVGAVPKELNGANLTENAAKICEIDESKVNGEYLGYFLRSEAGQAAIKALTVGSTQPKLALFRIDQIEVRCPPLREQHWIAALLSAFDDRITLLRETNATLEAIAQALFKSWFVDFDPVRAKLEGRVPEGMDDATAALFPDGFEESELGLVPTGWITRTVGEIVQRVGMGPFGSDIKVSTFVASGIPVLNGKNLSALLLDDVCTNFITREHADRLKKSCVRSGDIVITHRGTLGQVSLVPGELSFDEFVVSQSQFFLSGKSETMTPEWMTYFLRSPVGQQLLLSNTSQVGVPAIARPVTHLRSIKLVVPNVEILSRFSEIARVIHGKLVANRENAKSLVALRDTMLPRLISGALRLPKTQTAAGEALA